MPIGRQPSTTSLSKYASAKSPNADMYNGSTSRDFCNSFWGAGDTGANVLFARMRGAARTMDELRNFWKQRSLIEEEYATRLATLARLTLGKDEIGEMRNSLDTLRLETESQAGFHLQLALQIRNEFESQTAAFSTKQSLHKSTFQVPIEKKFKAKQAQESYVTKAREKYEGDVLRINSYTAQLNSQSMQAQSSGNKDLERIQLKLARAQQTVQANENDYASFTRALLDLTPQWEQDWKMYCDKCQDLEESRLEFMRENLWGYANAVSTLCVADDQSCEKIRLVLDQMEPEKDMVAFVQEYGTGNSIPDSPGFIDQSRSGVPGSTSPSSPSTPSSLHRPTARIAQFDRASEKPAPAYQPPEPEPPQFSVPPQQSSPIEAYPSPPPQPSSPPQQVQAPAQRTYSQDQDSIRRTPREDSYSDGIQSETQSVRSGRLYGSAQEPADAIGYQNGNGNTNGSIRSLDVDPPPKFVSSPPPAPVELPREQVPPQAPEPRSPSPIQDDNGKILFYVKALYDYTATIDEEFDFQVGDVIAVTATPDDGWWSGELLDEARRVPGRSVFPSNFVCLF